MRRNRYETIKIKTVNGELHIRRGYGECRNCRYKEIPFDRILGIDELSNKVTLDLYHLKENVYNYAKYKFNQDAAKYVPWVEEVNFQLEKGQVDNVIARPSENEKLPLGVVNLRTYSDIYGGTVETISCGVKVRGEC